MHARCLKKKGMFVVTDYSSVRIQSRRQGRDAPGTPVTHRLCAGAWSEGKWGGGGEIACLHGHIRVEHQTLHERVALIL